MMEFSAAAGLAQRRVERPRRPDTGVVDLGQPADHLSFTLCQGTRPRERQVLDVREHLACRRAPLIEVRKGALEAVKFARQLP